MRWLERLSNPTVREQVSSRTSSDAGAAPSSLKAAARWTEYAHMRQTGRDPGKPKVDKTRTLQLLADSGVRGPKTYGVYHSIEDVGFDELPEVFVLKPTELNGKRGVMLLHRVAGGIGFWDTMRGQMRTVESIVAEQKTWSEMYYKKRKRNLQFIAEELIVGENGAGAIPIDYKVYVFDGEPRFILQVDRNVSPAGMAFFDGDFSPMPDHGTKVKLGPKGRRIEAVVPACAEDILRSASVLSKALKTPFISIDCYATADGAVVGEVTVAPGGPYAKSLFEFSDEYDLEMGQAWTDALMRLGQTIPMYDEAWNSEERRSSGLPMILK